jgi:hypothetical protein
MALRDDFQEAIKAGKLKEALILAMTQAMELNITTWVTSTGGETGSAAQPGHRLHTRIDIMQGKIENEVGDRFIGYGPYQELRDYHQQQVTQSHAIVQSNLYSLQQLFGVLTAIQQQNQQIAARQAGLPPLELSPLPPLVSQPARRAEPDLNQPSSVIPSLRESRPEPPLAPEPLAPLPSLRAPSPPRATRAEDAIATPPAPEMPVSELEIEDWEEAVGIQSLQAISPSEEELPADLLSLEDLEPDLDEEEQLWEEEDLEDAHPDAIATPSDAAVEEDWEEFETTSPAEPPVAEMAREEIPEEEDRGDRTEPSSVVAATPIAAMPGEVFFEEEDWGDPIEPPMAAIAQSAAQATSMDVEELSDKEDWGDFSSAGEVSDALASEPVALDTEEAFSDEENWGDFTPEEQLGSGTSAAADLLDEEEEEDWGDFPSAEETPEPLTNESANLIPGSEFTQDDWGEFTEEELDSEPSVPDLRAVQLPRANKLAEDDWGEFTEEALDSDPSVPDLRTVHLTTESELVEDEDWGEFTEEELDLEPGIMDAETNNSAAQAELVEDEDWGDLTEEESAADLGIPDLNTLNLESDREWTDEWIEEEPNPESTVPNLNAANAGNDSDWEEFESLDPFANPSESESSLSNVDPEEDWDNFAAEELEPYPNLSESEGDRDLGTLEASEASGTNPLSSKEQNPNVILMPPPTGNDWENSEPDEVWFDEPDFGEQSPDEVFPSDEELFGEVTAIQASTPPDSPDRPSRSSSGG